jgi:hypothetical protein
MVPWGPPARGGTALTECPYPGSTSFGLLAQFPPSGLWRLGVSESSQEEDGLPPWEYVLRAYSNTQWEFGERRYHP